MTNVRYVWKEQVSMPMDPLYITYILYLQLQSTPIVHFGLTDNTSVKEYQIFNTH